MNTTQLFASFMLTKQNKEEQLVRKVCSASSSSSSSSQPLPPSPSPSLPEPAAPTPAPEPQPQPQPQPQQSLMLWLEMTNIPLPRRFDYQYYVPSQGDTLFQCIEKAVFPNVTIHTEGEIPRKLHLLSQWSNEEMTIARKYWRNIHPLRLTYAEFWSYVSLLGSGSNINTTVLPILASIYKRSILVFDDYRYVHVQVPPPLADSTSSGGSNGGSSGGSSGASSTILIYRHDARTFGLVTPSPMAAEDMIQRICHGGTHLALQTLDGLFASSSASSQTLPIITSVWSHFEKEKCEQFIAGLRQQKIRKFPKEEVCCYLERNFSWKQIPSSSSSSSSLH